MSASIFRRAWSKLGRGLDQYLVPKDPGTHKSVILSGILVIYITGKNINHLRQAAAQDKVEVIAAINHKESRILALEKALAMMRAKVAEIEGKKEAGRKGWKRRVITESAMALIRK